MERKQAAASRLSPRPLPFHADKGKFQSNQNILLLSLSTALLVSKYYPKYLFNKDCCK